MATKLAGITLKKRDVRLIDVSKFFQGLAQNKVSIGIHAIEGRTVGSTNLPNKANVLERAYWNEFGTQHWVSRDFKKRSKLNPDKWIKFKKGQVITVGARPFVRIYLYPDKLLKIMNEYAKQYNLKMNSGLKSPIANAKELLKVVALTGQDEMQRIIGEKELLEPNHDLTIELKGFDFPLFETGQMLGAIKGKVSKR